MVDRQQQADNDGDYYGLRANLLGREAQVMTGGVSRRECSRDRRGHRQKNSQHSANGRFHPANMRLRQAGSKPLFQAKGTVRVVNFVRALLKNERFWSHIPRMDQILPPELNSFEFEALR